MSFTLLANRRFPSWTWLIPACGLLAIAGVSGWAAESTLGPMKPLVTLLILLHAASLPSGDQARRRWVLAGLASSFVGECAMAHPTTYSAGLCSFVLAQCCYLVMIRRMVRLQRLSVWFGLYAVVVVWAVVMWSARPLSVFIPTAAFMCLLGLVSVHADVWWWRSRGTPQAAAARAAALGGLLWMLADLLLTFSVHVFWVPGSIAITLTLYWLAQWQFASISSAQPVER